uniref:Uncharacterized protein n=1 Tax=Fagus sylvatica TaxID=28930 RepID=A0A2N9IBC0_FAGSY
MRELWPKLRKNGPTLSQILLSIVDKTAYLGGNVCAKILSDPLKLGPQAKTLRQEVHFSYHMQLSDRQELLRSSRNLSQKMTPWHKEHSDGLCSQGTKNVFPPTLPIFLTRNKLIAEIAAFARRVFPARNKLIREPGCVGKIMTPATTWNSRFADSIPRLTGIFIGKVHKNSSDTPTSGSHNSLVRTPIHVQTLYRWKEDVESFPTICCMTHFEFRKTSKTALENRVKKDTRTETEEDSRSCWRGRIRPPRGGTTTRAGPYRAARDGPARGVHAVL